MQPVSLSSCRITSLKPWKKGKHYEEWIYHVLFTFASLIQKNVKSVRPFRPCCLWTSICHVLCLSPTYNTQGLRMSWILIYGLGHFNSSSRKRSCQKDFPSQMSTCLWLGFTSPIAPCLRTVLLKTKILFSQKEGKEWAPKISTGTFLWNFK